MSEVTIDTIFGSLDTNQVKTLRDGIGEISIVLSRIDNEKQAMKDIVDSLFDDTKVPKKIINRIAKAYHKQSFAEEVANDSEFESLYNVVVK